MGKESWQDSWPLLEEQRGELGKYIPTLSPLTLQHSTGISYWLNSNKGQKIQSLMQFIRVSFLENRAEWSRWNENPKGNNLQKKPKMTVYFFFPNPYSFRYELLVTVPKFWQGKKMPYKVKNICSIKSPKHKICKLTGSDITYPQILRELASKSARPLEIIEGFLWKLTQDVKNWSI